MKPFHFSIDLGDTLLDRSLPRIQYGLDQVMPIFPGAVGALTGLHYGSDGCCISVISKIKPGQEGIVFQNLNYHNLTPFVISARDVHFCYSREAKGSIARNLGTLLHVDDRAEALNAVHHAGVPHKVFFTAAHARREAERPLEFEGCHFASNWDDVFRIICIIRSAQ